MIADIAKLKALVEDDKLSLTGALLIEDAIKRIEELEQTFTDDRGVIWLPPTAEAYQKVCTARDKWQARAEAAEKRVAKLEAALQPFVIPRDGAHSGAQSDNSPVFAFDDQEITVGDFRRARKALGDQP